MRPSERCRVSMGLVALLLVGAAGLAAAGTSAPAWHRVTGHVSSGNFCLTDADGVDVKLQPGGRGVMAEADGTFVFDDVPDGDYMLTFGTLAFPLPLTVDGRDESIQFCLDCPSALQIEPGHGPPGIVANAVGGGCYALHSGRFGTITLDDVVVGHGGGSQTGNFLVRVLIPRDAVPGPHRFLLSGSPGEVGPIASYQFIVAAGSPPCIGDCNGDGVVSINEILRGIRGVLNRFEDTCTAYPDTVTVDMVIAAISDALAGCTPPISGN